MRFRGDLLVICLFCFSSTLGAGESSDLPMVKIPQIKTLAVQLAPSTGEEERSLEIDERWYELRLQRAPELLLHRQLVLTAEERIERDTCGVSIPVCESSRFVVLARREGYAFNPADAPDESAFFAGLRLRYHAEFSRTLQAWVEAEPYTGSDTSGIGGALGINWQPLRGLFASFGAEIWRPWTENTLSVQNDGWQHAVEASMRLEWTRKLSFSATGRYAWYGVGDDAPGGDRRVGENDRWSARMEYILWQRPHRVTGKGFWNTDAMYEDTLTTGLTAYANVECSRYDMDADFTVVPITPESMDIRVGLLYNHALSKHWGVSVEGYVGQDHDRDIPWGQLWGGSGRMFFIPNGHYRVWGGYAVSSATNTAVATGKEKTFSFGVNINF